jgi:hypothetical protein
VRDTGTGIPAEELPHIFERFHRMKGARGRSYEGSGIGLSLVQDSHELTLTTKDEKYDRFRLKHLVDEVESSVVLPSLSARLTWMPIGTAKCGTHRSEWEARKTESIKLRVSRQMYAESGE